MKRKVYNIPLAMDSDRKTDMYNIKRESYLRKKFYIPGSIGGSNVIIASDNFDLTSLQTLKDKDSEVQYDKDQVDEAIANFKEEMITSLSQEASVSETITEPTLIANGFSFVVKESTRRETYYDKEEVDKLISQFKSDMVEMLKEEFSINSSPVQPLLIADGITFTPKTLS